MKPDLKDVLDIDKELEKGNKNICILAGVGAGKSTWVKEVLAKKGSILFITSRKATVNQDIECSCFKDGYSLYTENNQTLFTNARLSSVISKLTRDNMNELDEFLELFDYIVVDEAHSIASDSTFAPASMDVLTFIEYAQKKEKIIILMTGTVEPIEWYLKEHRWVVLDYMNICKYVHPQKLNFVIQREVLKKIEKNSQDGQVIYFMNHVGDIGEQYLKLLQSGKFCIDDIAVVVAKKSQSEIYKKIKHYCKDGMITIPNESSETDVIKKIMQRIKDNDEQVYKFMIEKKRLPESCKVLLATSTLREGINIFNDNMTVICDNHILSNLIQFFGRVRVDDTQVWIVEDSSEHKIEKDDWLYNYASYEVETANKYLEEHKKNDDPFIEIELDKLKKHLKETNKYIYFNCIESRFKVSEIKYREEERVLRNMDMWLDNLRKYCRHYSINQPTDTYDEICKNNIPDILKRLSDKKIMLYAKESPVQTITNIINKACYSTAKSVSNLNKQLEKNGFKYEFISDKETKGEQRDKTYWVLVSKK